MECPGQLRVGCGARRLSAPSLAPCAARNLRHGRRLVGVRAALIQQVIRDPEKLSKHASKYGLAVTELRDADIVGSVTEAQHTVGKSRGKKNSKQAQEVVQPPMQVAPAPLGPSWVSPGLLGVGAVAVGLAAFRVMGGGPAGAPSAAAAALAGLFPAAAKPAAPDALRPAAATSTAAPSAAAARTPSSSSNSGIGIGVPGTPAVGGPTPSPAAAVTAAARPASPVVGASARGAVVSAARLSSASVASSPVPGARNAPPRSPTPTGGSRAASPVMQTGRKTSQPATAAAAVAVRPVSPVLLPPADISNGQVGFQRPASTASEARGVARGRTPEPAAAKAGQVLDKLSHVFSSLDPKGDEKIAALKVAADEAAVATAAAQAARAKAAAEAAVAQAAAAKASAAEAAASSAALTAAKLAVLDLLYTTGRGLGATPEQRALVEEHITALEAVSPTRNPGQATQQLAGTWKLLYTNHTPTLLVLNAVRSLPLSDLGEVYQVIEPDTLTAYNQIDLALPFLMSLTARTPLQPSSGRSYQVKFSHVGLQTHIHTPQLLAALSVPEEVQVLGTTLDLRPLQRLLAQVNTGVKLVDGWVSAPTFAVSPAASHPSSMWLLTTYLDDTLRINRDAAGRVFVMAKDVAVPEETLSTE